MELGSNILKSILNGNTTTTTPTIDTTRKNLSNHNAGVVNAIMCGLENLEFVNVMHCK